MKDKLRLHPESKAPAGSVAIAGAQRNNEYDPWAVAVFMKALAAPGDRLPNEDRERLRQAATSWLAFMGSKTFDALLGLIPPPSQHSRSRITLAERDKQIVEAAKLLKSESASEWKVCGDLSDEIKLMRKTYWPVWQKLESAPTEAPRVRQILFLAFKEAARLPKLRMPTDRRRLISILHNATGAS